MKKYFCGLVFLLARRTMQIEGFVTNHASYGLPGMHSLYVPSARQTQVVLMEDYFQILCPFPIGLCTEACLHFLRHCLVAPIVSGSAITFPGFTFDTSPLTSKHVYHELSHKIV